MIFTYLSNIKYSIFVVPFMIEKYIEKIEIKKKI